LLVRRVVLEDIHAVGPAVTYHARVTATLGRDAEASRDAHSDLLGAAALPPVGFLDKYLPSPGGNLIRSET
jgi:hypothetical protein